MKRILGIVVLIILIITGCTYQPDTDYPAEIEGMIIASPPVQPVHFESQTVNELYEQLFIESMRMHPESIDFFGDLTSFGVEPQHHRLTDASPSYFLQREAFLEAALIHLATFDVNDTFTDHINHANIKWALEIELEGLQYRRHTFNLSTYLSDIRFMFQVLAEYHPFSTREDVEAFIARIYASREKIIHLARRYQDNAQAGYFMDPYSIEASINQLRGFYHDNIERIRLYQSAKAKIDALNIPAAEKQSYLQQIREALSTAYVPAMKHLENALTDSKELSKEAKGVWHLPDGDAYYQYALKLYTTTDLTAEQIHQIGLKEVARIQTQMQELYHALGYTSTLSANMWAMRQNEITYRGNNIMKRYLEVVDTLETVLPALFLTENLPKTRPEIKASPGGNFYVSPAVDGSRPGVYYLDMSYTHVDSGINTLAVHETIPGHHLEREHERTLTTLPMYRKLAFCGAYIEGWALYAEQLMDEFGFNDTPQRRIGFLASELHRAARLVVDTGLHYKRWSFEQAVDYLVSQGLLSQAYARSEVTRYLSWPAQACSYKIGQMKILALREEAKQKLEDAFDIKHFHRAILENGSMPLFLLEEQVHNYIRLAQGN